VTRIPSATTPPPADPRVAVVTGAAGFIGFHVARRLLADGWIVVGIDGFTTYYDVNLKRDRWSELARHNGFRGHVLRLEDADAIAEAVAVARPDVVVHLAAQAGVRYSIEAPRTYVDANLVGTFNVLEACRETPPRHLLMASTSSVYGNGPHVPFAEGDESARPLSLYAATKKATEAIAHAYAHIHRLPTTMFRFFTVYGPWGRPDMALFKFTAAILEGRPIDVYGHGRMSRDFTYIDDLVAGIAGLIDAVPGDAPASAADSLSPDAPFRIVNVGTARPIALEDFITAIEAAVGRKAERNYLPMQPGDVPRTFADVSLLRDLVPDLPPPTPLRDGVAAFVAWYRARYAA